MGEMTFVKDGIATTIQANGDITSLLAERCDGCNELRTPDNGLTIRDAGGDIVLWLCKECRG